MVCKFVYLASPYSHPDKDVEQVRYEKITKIAADLTARFKYCFFLPITQSHNLVAVNPQLKGSFEHWRDIDLTAISKSDEVWVVKMPGWMESIGVQSEIAFAEASGIPVKYLDEAGNNE